MKSLDKKTKTYLVLGLAVLITIIHIWHPVTLSPTNSGDRSLFMFIILFFAFSAKNGSSTSRIAIGFSFSFCAAINLLIAIVYNIQNGIGNFIEILFWGLALGGIGLALLMWKDVRVFEEQPLTQKTHAI